jgi:hypothetical protein
MATDVWVRGPHLPTLHHRCLMPTPLNSAPELLRANLIMSGSLDVVGGRVSGGGTKASVIIPPVLLYLPAGAATQNRVPLWSSKGEFKVHQGEMKPMASATVADPQRFAMLNGAAVACSRLCIEDWWLALGECVGFFLLPAMCCLSVESHALCVAVTGGVTLTVGGCARCRWHLPRVVDVASLPNRRDCYRARSWRQVVGVVSFHRAVGGQHARGRSRGDRSAHSRGNRCMHSDTGGSDALWHRVP